MATSKSKHPPRPARPPARALNVLFTCVGRRVELLQAFRRAGKRLRIRLTIHAADHSPLAPGMHVADRCHHMPPLESPSYMRKLLDVARRERIDLVIPLIDSELSELSRAKERFAKLGTRVVISSEWMIRICRDKLLTFQTLRAAGIDTPDTWKVGDKKAQERHKFPMFIKPREGSAGHGNYIVADGDELRVLSRRVRDPIVQEYVPGTEHTLDVYTGFDGVAKCVVPRRRLEVRGGEVSKSMTVMNRTLTSVGTKVAAALHGGQGVITVQCMTTKKGRLCVIEINPRFGGGAPLSIHAGADFPYWLMREYLRRPVTIDPSNVTDGLLMLRYDQSVFRHKNTPPQ